MPAAWPRRQRLCIGGGPRAEPGRAGGLTGRARAALPRRPPPPPARAAATAEAARRRRRRASGGSGAASSAATASRGVRRGSAAAREPRRPRAATEAVAFFPRGAGPLLGRLLLLCLGSQPSRGTAGLAPALTPATAATGGEQRRRLRLVFSSPHPRPPNLQRCPAHPSRLQRPWGQTRRARRASEPPPPPLQPRTAPRGGRRAPGSSSRGSARPLGPALSIPGRSSSLARSMRAEEPAEAPARRWGAEARGPAPRLCLSRALAVLPRTACSRQTLPPLDLPKQSRLWVTERLEPQDCSSGKQYRGVERDRQHCNVFVFSVVILCVGDSNCFTEWCSGDWR